MSEDDLIDGPQIAIGRYSFSTAFIVVHVLRQLIDREFPIVSLEPTESRRSEREMERRRMDADGGRAVHRERRTRKLAVVVAVQNVLVTTCLVVSLYVCWNVQTRTPSAEQASKDNVHIRFDPVSDLSENGTVKFTEVFSSNMMSLAGENKDQIYVNCTGPYVLYMYLCYKDKDETEASGLLQLQVVGRKAPVSSFPLNASHEVCRGLHSIAYLRDKETLSLQLNCTAGFKIKTVTVGLSYMLGSQCQFF
ncbi:uncharacterized protein LOC116394885 [Anarrhichthys ocellatus]|uniref:uncharacterized protein LOC116394885 n=1 Tax=Anarrhichthys ocellatus TaxID=433405 RepID=UPI0012EDC794|nr:uncharacterized protein LOC116394885 [Anarrhichthys ocellatus]